MHSTNDSMIFKFQLSNNNFENVEVKLNAENGLFSMFLAKNYIPSADNYDFKGDEHVSIKMQQ